MSLISDMIHSKETRWPGIPKSPYILGNAVALVLKRIENM